MKRHALFVGVNDYADQTIQNLHCAVNDATELAGFFKYHARFDRAEALPNPRTCDVVLDHVRDMMSDLGAGDEFLFFFAGHGVKTQDGLRLVCAGDPFNAVKHAWAGLPFERLKLETAESCNRLFILDACRTDVLATKRGATGAMERGTRDLILSSASPVDAVGGTLTILCSCDDGECAGELLQFRHGLFSMAMLELLEEESRCGRRVLVTDDFAYRHIPARMRALAEKSGMDFMQRPQKNGPPILLLDGRACPDRIPPPVPPPVSPIAVKTGRRPTDECSRRDDAFTDDVVLPVKVFDDYQCMLGRCGWSDIVRKMKELGRYVGHKRERTGWQISNAAAFVELIASVPVISLDELRAKRAADRHGEIVAWFRNHQIDKEFDLATRAILQRILDSITNTSEED